MSQLADIPRSRRGPIPFLFWALLFVLTLIQLASAGRSERRCRQTTPGDGKNAATAVTRTTERGTP